MLFQMLDKLNIQINKINVAIEAPKFAAQLRKMRPTLEEEIKSHGIAQNKIEDTILALSMAQIVFIKGIPTIVVEMSKMLKSKSGEPAFRCVVASSLAYLVQPNDLLPDNLSGVYGFIDDGLLLREGCALSWEISGDMARAEEARKIFQFIFIAVPDGSREQFQSAISGMAMTLNILRALDPMMAEMTTQMMIANPLQPIEPQGPTAAGGNPSIIGSKLINYPRASGPQYTWSNGTNVGVNFPSGGGVATNGRDIFIL